MFKREIETDLYQREIDRLKKQVCELSVKLENANKYKHEYESLCKQCKRDLNELNNLRKQTEQLHHELKNMIQKSENNE